MWLSHPRRPLPRQAYTLVELLMVVAIIGVLAAVSMPRLGRIRDQGQLASALTRFTRGVMAARQAAIQRGKPAYFTHNANVIKVWVDTIGDGSETIVVTPPQNLVTLYGVEVTAPAGLTSIQYDPRGVATQTSQQVFKFKHTGSGRVDSLCVSMLGNTIREKCP